MIQIIESSIQYKFRFAKNINDEFANTSEHSSYKRKMAT